MGTAPPRSNALRRDASINLDNHGFRYYDPEIGRYLTRDPIGYGDGLNVYLSVHNNPINHIDPLGLCAKCGNDKCAGCGFDITKVLEIIKANDKKVYERAKKLKVPIIRFTSAKDIWQPLDKNGKEVGETYEVDLSLALGGNSAKDGIRLNMRLDNTIAAIVLRHELEHAFQKDDWKKKVREAASEGKPIPKFTKKEYLKNEVDACVVDTEFALKLGAKTRPGYVDDKGKIDRKYIEQEKNDSDHYNPKGRKRVGRKYDEGKEPEVVWDWKKKENPEAETIKE